MTLTTVSVGTSSKRFVRFLLAHCAPHPNYVLAEHASIMLTLDLVSWRCKPLCCCQWLLQWTSCTGLVGAIPAVACVALRRCRSRSLSSGNSPLQHAHRVAVAHAPWMESSTWCTRHEPERRPLRLSACRRPSTIRARRLRAWDRPQTLERALVTVQKAIH